MSGFIDRVPFFSSVPPRQDGLGICCLDLLRKTGVIEAHKHIVSLVRGIAYRIADDDDAIAKVNRIENGREHANIGFRSRDYQVHPLAGLVDARAAATRQTWNSAFYQ